MMIDGGIMKNKWPDERRSQLNITNLLNEIVEADNRVERQRIKGELRSWTYGFWYKKFGKIRKILQSENSDIDRCNEIKKILDTPRWA
jgi:hypothetical protein